MEIILNIASAIFSLLAALFWFLSAKVKLPGKTNIGLAELNSGVNKQSNLSSYAAICAAIVALIQTSQFFLCN